ncbi:type VI secretion system baseplate subunit TssG [Acinetobacter sp. YH12239]|uniref:type VI secretion system baseplate subunit TssG n=1 Tax=Acinetobacter sp. YH12239 TaxID=2601166 RepID=UPI0015D37298|nr:type VI secretion system baseplate subunit TssG [Acinetobacter sp. YH12239]
MRAERWWQEASVTDHLFQQPTAYEFIQSIRLLRHVPYARPYTPWDRDFKFHPSLELNFPKKEIESLALEDEKVQLTNLMVGLTGMQGALPYSYTNKVKSAPRKFRVETTQFLSLFNHKLTSQFVDATVKYNLPVRYEVESENHYLNIIHALNGYISQQHQQQELDDYFAEFAGLMQGQNNTAHALKTMIAQVFNQHVAIQEFIPEKFKLEPQQRTSLGGATPSLLGLNTFCGETITQIDGKIEIQIGPLDRKTYLDFLPQQKLSLKLKKLLQSWCSPTLLVDVRLILSKQEIQPITLNSEHSMGLSQGAFLAHNQPLDNDETCYPLLGVAS